MGMCGFPMSFFGKTIGHDYVSVKGKAWRRGAIFLTAGIEHGERKSLLVN
jgi:hypothetical protein